MADMSAEQSRLLIGSGRKRKKQDPSKLCQQLYDTIRNLKKEDGSMLCDTFIRCYEAIENPVDLIRVQQKLDTDSYDDIDELSADVELLVNNVKACYKPDSVGYKDACALLEQFNINKNKILEVAVEDDTEPKSKTGRVGRLSPKSETNDSTQSKEDDFDPYEELFTTVMNATDPTDNRLLCSMLQLLPSKKLFPDYYDVIERPIDLKFIATKIQNGAYLALNELEKDFLEMTKNACAFNEPGYQTYKDAKALERIFLTRKQEIDSGNANPAVKTKREQNLSSIIAAFNEMVESSEDEDEPVKTEGSGPLWLLFDQLYKIVNESGAPLGESLWKLPNRRAHLEYYTQIKNPISMSQIRANLKNDEYSNISEMIADLNLMLNNAKNAFPATNKVYKDAEKIQNILNQNIVDSGIDQEDSDEIEGGKASIASVTSAQSTATSLPLTPVVSQMPKKKGRPRVRPIAATVTQTLTPSLIVKRRFEYNPALTKNLLALQEYLKDFSLGGRRPILLFMFKPSKKFYPEYYKEIQHPIDMNTIDIKIQGDRYGSLDDLVGDYRLMFSNCRKYNENNSMICEDANSLEWALNEKLKEYSGLTKRGLNTKLTLDEKVKEYSELTERRTQYKLYKSKTKSKKRMTPLNHKLQQLYDAIRKHREPAEDRQLALIFKKLPSKKDCPDYYEIIKNPIDMEKIALKLKQRCYDTVDELACDFMLMFENACKYKRPDSQIYKDSLILQQICIQTKLQLNCENGAEAVSDVTKIKNVKRKNGGDKVPDVSETIHLNLESCNETIPDNSNALHVKRENGGETISDISDTSQVNRENCGEAVPDVLNAIQVESENGGETVPDVSTAVQELLTSLFTRFYNHQDEEGRCYRDSLGELPEYDDGTDGSKVQAISLDLIKLRLDRGLYKRLDIFQEDIFACLERARHLSRTDSQVFEDSIELQSFLIKKRDEICKCGEILSSSALNYSALHLSAEIEVVRQTKSLQEEPEQEQVTDKAAKKGEDSMMFGQEVYTPGDFVYFDSPNKNVPKVIYIERLWTNKENIKMLYGNVFLRPFETYHVISRKFLEQELFKSERHQAVPLSNLKGKCFVMSIKDYIKLKPEGFRSRDVYVCEFRYSSKSKSFRKIKNWPFLREINPVNLISRVKPLEIKRIMSVSKERYEKHKRELVELQLEEAPVEKEKSNVVVFLNGGEEGNTYYEQYNCFGVVKTGDYVYVITETGQSIAQIHAIWETKGGKSYFRGPRLLTPPEIPNVYNRLFYRQEVLLSTTQETLPILAIVGRCAVLDYDDYISSRPTEIAEKDIYVCESMYDELDKNLIRRLSWNDLQKFTHSQMVTQDEMYHFPRIFAPPKITAASILEVPKGLDERMDDSIDGGSLSAGSNFISNSSPGPSEVTAFLKQNKLGKKNMTTGYILYSAEARKTFVVTNPEVALNDITKIIANGWRTLSAADRRIWEEKADKINKDTNLASFQSIPDKLNKATITTGYILYSAEVRKACVVTNPEVALGHITKIIANGWRKLAVDDRQMWEKKARKINEENSLALLQSNPDKASITTGYLLYSAESRKSVGPNPDVSRDINKIIGTNWMCLSAADQKMWREEARKINEENNILTGKNPPNA